MPDTYNENDLPLKGTGALIDNRPQEEKDRDFKWQELVASAEPVNWTVKSIWRQFPIFDQNGSGSCVAQTVAKMLGIMYWLINAVYVHFSATHVYKRRKNAPSGGMLGTDAGDIAGTGVTLEELVPSQLMTDSQMDGIQIAKYKEQVGEIFKTDKYIQPPIKDIDAVASIIQKTGKPLMVWFYFNYPEWTVTPKNIYGYDNPANAPCRHSVTAVDFTLLGSQHTSDSSLWGKKALIIDDSWGTSYGQKGQRFITEDFFKARNYFVLYFMNFKFNSDNQQAERPRYTFTRDLSYNPQAPITYGDKDVIALQNILKFEGLFPVNSDSTGYFGSVTKDAVVKFQKKHGITPTSGYVGAKTRAKLNELYGV